MARGDKNKRSTSDRGNGDQSNKGFTQNSKQQKSNHNKRHKGRRRSDPNEPQADSEIDQNRDSEAVQELKVPQTGERRFNILVDRVPYMIKATPFTFNGEIRYMVSFNGSPEHVFTWDSSLGQLRAIDDDSSTLPVNLEEAISEKLQSKMGSKFYS